MLSIRGGSGLGDSLYVQAIARHLVARGERVEVCSDWPDVFWPLAGKVAVSPFRRKNVDLIAHYAPRKHMPGTDQFRDCCIQAGIAEQVDLVLDWEIGDRDLTERLACDGRPIVCVQLPRAPMGRTDGFGAELLPNCGVIQRAIDRLKDRALIVQIGAGAPLYRYAGIDVDLAGKTSVAQMIDVASVASAFLGFVSFIVPLAESLSKPVLLVWSRRGLNSQEPRAAFIRAITPGKVLHRPTSRFVIDDCSDAELLKATDDLCDQVRRPLAA